MRRDGTKDMTLAKWKQKITSRHPLDLWVLIRNASQRQAAGKSRSKVDNLLQSQRRKPLQQQGSENLRNGTYMSTESCREMRRQIAVNKPAMMKRNSLEGRRCNGDELIRRQRQIVLECHHGDKDWQDERNLYQRVYSDLHKQRLAQATRVKWLRKDQDKTVPRQPSHSPTQRERQLQKEEEEKEEVQEVSDEDKDCIGGGLQLAIHKSFQQDRARCRPA